MTIRKTAFICGVLAVAFSVVMFSILIDYDLATAIVEHTRSFAVCSVICIIGALLIFESFEREK